jgi:hypothetical protein
MKLFVSLFLLQAVSCSAFVQQPSHKKTSVILLNRIDSSNAVAEAMRITKEKGATSSEARVAWDIVEEMDASDNSGAINTATVTLSARDDYANQVRALAYLLSATQETMDQIGTLVSNLKNLDLEDPTLSKLPTDASGLKTVLAEAKAAVEVHGPNSPEAEAAWQSVETCADGMEECSVDSMYRYSAAALKAHHYYDAAVDSVFLEEALDALKTVSSLRRFVNVENKRLQADNKDGNWNPFEDLNNWIQGGVRP